MPAEFSPLRCRFDAADVEMPPPFSLMPALLAIFRFSFIFDIAAYAIFATPPRSIARQMLGFARYAIRLPPFTT